MALTSIFHETNSPDRRGGLLALLTSGAMHAAAVIASLVLYEPPQPPPPRHYQIQMLHLQPPLIAPLPLKGYSVKVITPAEPETHPPDAQRLAKNKAPQTLITPHAPPDVKLIEKIPLPFALAWAKDRSTTKPIAAKGLVLQGKMPSAPNIANSQELSSPLPLAIASSAFTPAPILPIPAPQRVQAPLPTTGMPGGLTMLAPVNPPSEASIIALPDNPPVTTSLLAVPKVNQIAESAKPKIGTPLSAETHASSPAANPATSPTAESVPPAPTVPPGADGMTRIAHSKNGKAAVTLLGESLSNQYPDVTTPFSGKIVSTVFLDLRLKKAWTLEFSEIVADDADRTGGAPEAPYPFLVFRPNNLQMPPDTEAVLVSGVLSATGELGDLRLLLPRDWGQKELLLHSLTFWQFRPASRHGKAVAVKILLIIPRDDDEG